MSTQSPRALLAVSAASCIAVGCLSLALALQAPYFGLDFGPDSVADENSDHDPDQDPYLQVRRVHRDGPNAGLVAEGTRVRAFQAGGETIAASHTLHIEEPDVLPTFDEYNQLMRVQTQLSSAAVAGELWLVTDTGARHALRTAPRPLSQLPGMFWLQLLFGIGGALTGALVWGARRSDQAARLYAMTGLGYLIFAPAAAVYSTRELLLDGDVFRALSVANHFGALLFTASLTSLLSRYPHRLGRLPAPALCYGVSGLLFLADALQLVSPTMFHLAVLGVFSMSFVFAAGQWWKTRQDPSGRAALRWFLLSIYLATGLFAGMIIVPAALNLPQPASQGVMFGAFLIMYWGLALGIVRYRLFQLEQWWHAIVAWFVGGLAMVVVDGLLLSSVALPQNVALPVAIAIVGWLYFPLRQWLWDRMGRSDRQGVAAFLPRMLPLLIDARHGSDPERQLYARWPEMLAAVWQPLRIEKRAGGIVREEIRDNGLSLAVPSLAEPADAHFELSCPDQGGRLFTTRDLAIPTTLRGLVQLALETFRARDEGAQQERERIRRDLHDDIGARLLTLLHACEPSLQTLVREALVDTRALVQTLELGPTDSHTAAAAWRDEIQQRCDAAKVSLVWQADEANAPLQLSARETMNITRVLREAVSNALRHGGADRITVTLTTGATGLTLTAADNGNAAPQHTWKHGRGQHILRQRAEEIGARLEWEVTQGCSVTLTLERPPIAAD